MKYYYLLLFVILFGCQSASLVSTSNQTINVMGYAELKVQPDLSLITLQASAQSENKSETISQINQMVDSVVKRIKANKINPDELHINNLNIWWNDIIEKDKERKTEYNASQTIEIKVKYDLNKIEKLVQITRDFPRLNFNIGFDLSKTRRDSLESVVSAMALKNGSMKAYHIAEAANLRIIKIMDITYQSQQPGGFMKSAPFMALAQNRSADRVNLAPEDIQLSDNIKLTYLVRNK